MIRLLLGLSAGLLLPLYAHAEDRQWLTRPADPALGATTPHYASVTAGLKRFRVVEPKNWLTLNKEAASGPAMPGMSKQSMPGMKMDGADRSGHGGATPAMHMHGKGSM